MIGMKKKLCILLFFLLSAPLTFAQQKAKPKEGEGIASFLLRHNRSPKKYYDDFIRLNQSKFGKKPVLKMGFSYVIPPVKHASAAASVRAAVPPGVSG